MAPAAGPEQSPSRDQRRRGAPGPGGGARPSRVYSLLVGAAFIALIVVALLNTLRTTEGGLLGAGGDRGMAMPQFAVPDALGSLEGDANVYQDDCESSEIPCPADQRRTPACEVPGPGVIRVCDYFDRPLVLSFWFSRGGDCLPTQDLVDRVASRYRGRVNFLSVNIRDERAEVREVVRDRGWRIPVGHDADGAVSNIYRVGVCPTVAFLFPGGILRGASVGAEELDEGALAARVERLLRESRRRARTDR
jgi:thiol-disulfide isomerase/thioredoxin